MKADLKILCGLALLIAVLAAMALVQGVKAPPLRPIPEQVAEPLPSTSETKPTAPLFRESFAALLTPEVIAPRAPETKKNDSVADRFRLVTVSLSSDPNLSMAFIENVPAKTQKCYHPGEMLEDGVTVSEILDKGAVIATSEGTFLLGFGMSENLVGSNSSPNMPSGAGDQTALLHKFGGRRTGTNEWHFSRSRVMEYYEELKTRPERLVTVFDTMTPLYDENQRIQGYKVDIQGEAEFFKAIGFNQGDIVREVNGIPMCNRRVAENLIRRYAADDLDFIVIKMERDGKPVQQVYHSHK